MKFFVKAMIFKSSLQKYIINKYNVYVAYTFYIKSHLFII